jgi:hypothetical protein
VLLTLFYELPVVENPVVGLISSFILLLVSSLGVKVNAVSYCILVLMLLAKKPLFYLLLEGGVLIIR